MTKNAESLFVMSLFLPFLYVIEDGLGLRKLQVFEDPLKSHGPGREADHGGAEKTANRLHIERVEVFTESEYDPAEKESDECEDEQKDRYCDSHDTLVLPWHRADDLSCLSVYQNRIWYAIVFEREEPYGHHHVDGIVMDIDVVDRIEYLELSCPVVDSFNYVFGIERVTSVCGRFAQIVKAQVGSV